MELQKHVKGGKPFKVEYHLESADGFAFPSCHVYMSDKSNGYSLAGKIRKWCKSKWPEMTVVFEKMIDLREKFN